MNYFRNTKLFEPIAHRVNSYSFSLLETTEVKSISPNLIAHGVVSYNESGRMNAIIESSYCDHKNITNDTMYEGLVSVYKSIMDKMIISLN